MINSNILNAKILIIDDKEANIGILEGLLEMQGYTSIKTTTDSRFALSLFKSFKPDLILLDLMMPYLNGFDVMALLKTEIPAKTFLPILVLTADITMEVKQRALAEGATDFLSKPLDLIEVGLRIKNLLFSRYLNLQLEMHNKILDEKVRFRTFELEQSNIELKVAKEKAEASNRLKTAFINNITHEIRTPLTGIMGFGQILASVDLTMEEKNEYLEILKESSNRLIKTVNDFMDISLFTSNNIEIQNQAFSLIALFDDIYTKNKAESALKGLKFNYLAPSSDDEFLISSDKDLLQKVINHLVDNAIKFTKEGEISFGVEAKGQFLEFYVKDTGVGVNHDSSSLIFDSFMQENVTSTRGYEGSGLGLSIAKKIVALFGGDIWVNSVKGEGSTFYFTIPFNKVNN